ncbi:P-loop containing nucleoside triphosphate hydrolase protein [Phascolomyces articulosus]|uniref:P-loop containing nucleoside triphosphate hydrolase protein n=1 Tax=Phascolomyces articulosus TaxID=60185 RepID=A0AAD5PGC8_9FUNG|nr:P-loop containing nucleoside triphosphate hydrolase protein [Phascolomyces articulosus]
MTRRTNINNRLQKQLVIIGDGACGKTSLLIVYSREIFPEVHIPTVFETYVKEVEVDGKHIELALWDTAGQETFDRLRTLAYPDSDVIVIAYSIGEPETLENVVEKWVPEVAHHCPGLPYLLVGCKKDLRNDPATVEELRKSQLTPVSYGRGLSVAREISALDYVECSAKLNENINEVFTAAIRATLVRRKRWPSCKLL